MRKYFLFTPISLTMFLLFFLTSCKENSWQQFVTFNPFNSNIIIQTTPLTYPTLYNEANLYKHIFPKTNVELLQYEREDDELSGFNNTSYKADFISTFIDLDDNTALKKELFKQDNLPLQYVMASDAILIITNKNNPVPVKNLMFSELLYILNGNIQQHYWHRINRTWTQSAINIYAPSPKSGFMVGLKKQVNEYVRNHPQQFIDYSFLEFYQEGSIEEIIYNVQQDSFAVGILPFSTYKYLQDMNATDEGEHDHDDIDEAEEDHAHESNEHEQARDVPDIGKNVEVRIISINYEFPYPDNQALDTTHQSTAENTKRNITQVNAKYPLLLPLYLYVNPKAMTSKKVQNFIRLTLLDPRLRDLFNYVSISITDGCYSGQRIY